MTDRYTWKDVQRAADRYAEVLRDHDQLPMGVGLYVSKGSVTYGHTGELYVCIADDVDANVLYPIPGGLRLHRRARDSYDDLTLRIRMVQDLLRKEPRNVDY
jgi:hypothetical protein